MTMNAGRTPRQNRRAFRPKKSHHQLNGEIKLRRFKPGWLIVTIILEDYAEAANLLSSTGRSAEILRRMVQSVNMQVEVRILCQSKNGISQSGGELINCFSRRSAFIGIFYKSPPPRNIGRST